LQLEFSIKGGELDWLISYLSGLQQYRKVGSSAVSGTLYGEGVPSGPVLYPTSLLKNLTMNV